MKKFVSGLIVGVLLFAGASAFADSSSLIGQKVQGLFSIEKNGTKVADAVIVNGSTYAPVRAVAEATGSKLTVEGKKIIMGDTSTSTTSAPQGETAVKELQAARDKVVADIESHEKQIKGYKDNILPTYKSLADELANSGTMGQRAADDYAQFKKQVETWEAELTFLQARLAEIKAQLGE